MQVILQAEKVLPRYLGMIGFILSLTLLWPLMAGPFFTHHDDVQVIRLYEMHQCIKDWQIPCRWVPNLGGLYGYPLFNYYGPLPYYFGEIIYLLSGNLIFSVKVMFAFSFLGSYLTMYLLARRLWGELGGSLSAVLYSFAPYHALDFYVRGAMGEMWALMFFPLIIWSLIRLSDRPSLKSLVILALSIAGLITSHNLSTMLFMPVSLMFSALWLWVSLKWKLAWLYLAGFLLGGMVAAFYLLPAYWEKDLVYVETTTYGYFSYTEHFKGLQKIFLDRSWGWGASIREVPGGERDGMSYQIGWVHLVTLLLAVILTLLNWNRIKPQLWIVVFFTLITAISIFMIHPQSQFIWDQVEQFKFIQFPWRFLLVVIFGLSLICGIIFINIKKISLWLALVVVVVGFNFSYFRPESFLEVGDSELLSGTLWEKQIKRSIFDYLPKSAAAPPAQLATNDYQVLSGAMSVKQFQEGSNWLDIRLNVAEDAQVRLSRYYFPNWKVLVDNQETQIRYDNPLGLMTVDIPAGDHRLYAQLTNTPIRVVGNVVTLISLVGMGLVAVVGLSTVKQLWIKLQA